MIIVFAKTTPAFLSGTKTVTRRYWTKKYFQRWLNAWDTGHLVHDAWDKSPRVGGKKIGQFQLTARPYLEQLADMPLNDLEAEGGMCKTIDEYISFIGKTPETVVAVIRFERTNNRRNE